MVVHLSPKAKVLTLPLNWSQFLKTLIGAENYTLFQLPPRTRPASALRRFHPFLYFATLCCLSSFPLSLDFCHSDISFYAISNRSKYRDRVYRASGIFIERHVVR